MPLKGSRGRRVASVALLVASASLLLGGLLAAWGQRSLFDSRGFAEHATAALEQEAVRKALADRIVDQILIHGSAELVTVRPLLEATAAGMIRTPPFRALYETAVREAHASFFAGDDAFVLQLADVMILLTALLDRLDTSLVGELPAGLRSGLILLRRRDFATETLAVAADVRFLAWLLPGAGLLALALGLAVAPDRERALARVGFAAVAVGGFGLGAFLLTRISLVAWAERPDAALVRALWDVFAAPLRVWSLGLVVLGLALAAAASSRFGSVDVRSHLDRVARLAMPTPVSVGGRLLRALVVLAAAGALLAAPDRVLRTAALALGFYALYWALVEVLQLAGLGRGAPEKPGPVAAFGAAARGVLRWALPLALVGALGFAWLWRDARRALPLAPLAWSGAEACNGHVELCGHTLPEVALATAHNAMAAASERGWYFASHTGGLGDQLAFGIRGFQIDAYFGVPVEGGVRTDRFHTTDREALAAEYGEEFLAARDRVAERLGLVGEDVPRAVYLCHGFCELGATPLAEALAIFRDFLERHPREVIVIFVEDHVPAADVAAVFEDAGLTRWTHTHRKGSDWPTLGEMIERDERLLVMAENDGSGPDWYQPGFELTQETPYSFAAPAEFSCEPNRGLPESPLFQLNHWIEKVTPSPGDAELVNEFEFLLKRALACQAERGMLPNLVAVNFYEIGGVLRVVDVLNGIGARPPPPIPRNPRESGS
jgi:hypothetical protein